MSILTDGKLQAIVGKALGSSKVFGEAATLHTRNAGVGADFAPVKTFVDSAITVTPIVRRNFRRFDARVSDGTLDVIFYQLGATVAPRPGDETTIRGTRHEIIEVAPDPAAATWLCNLRPV